MKRFFTFVYIIYNSIVSVGAITLSIPPANGNKDIAVTGPTQVESNSDLIIGYIQLINKYLWFAMIVLLFGLIVWMGFKLMTSESDDAKGILKQGLIAAGAGVMVIMLSYTIVRLVINII